MGYYNIVVGEKMDEKTTKLIGELSKLGFVHYIDDGKTAILRAHRVSYKELRDVLDKIDYVGIIRNVQLVATDDEIRVIIELL